MGFLDQISRTISQGVDRAKFEAEKFQKTTRVQGELSDLKRQLDEKMIELGQRAYELHRAGQITAPSIADLAHRVDQLRSGVVIKEEELRLAQAETFVEMAPAPPPQAQSIPITQEPAPPPQAPSSAPPPAAAPTTRTCPACSFQMPGTAVFCPNCGFRVGS